MGGETLPGCPRIWVEVLEVARKEGCDSCPGACRACSRWPSAVVAPASPPTCHLPSEQQSPKQVASAALVSRQTQCLFLMPPCCPSPEQLFMGKHRLLQSGHGVVCCCRAERQETQPFQIPAASAHCASSQVSREGTEFRARATGSVEEQALLCGPWGSSGEFFACLTAAMGPASWLQPSGLWQPGKQGWREPRERQDPGEKHCLQTHTPDHHWWQC